MKHLAQFTKNNINSYRVIDAPDQAAATKILTDEGATAVSIVPPADPVALAASELANARADAIKALLTDTSPQSKFVRAVLLVMLDEINVIRALLPGPPAPRTINQFKTAIQSKVNAGTAD